jgi:hypothetical protein
MNCLSFRRQLMVDPQQWDDALAAHAEQCPACARARERALGFEAALYAALLLEVDIAGAEDAAAADEGGDDDDEAPPARTVHPFGRR